MNDLLTRENFRHCEICSYHEAGHILFAYLCGYSCREVQLIDGQNEKGFTSYAIIDYGRDAFIASQFTGPGADVEFFRALPLAERLEAIEVGRRLARMYLGGSVAAAVFQNDGNVQIPLPMQIDLGDLVRVEFIHYVIGEIASDQDELFVENGLHDALYTLSNINVWETISDLSKRLLKTNQLHNGDIEECLEEHGIIFDEPSPLDL